MIDWLGWLDWVLIGIGALTIVGGFYIALSKDMEEWPEERLLREEISKIDFLYPDKSP